jgi:hypothetical protein
MSVNSDGKGNVQFFKVEDIAKLMAEGNLKNYNWNSHTSIAHFHGVDEDKWNKWEYNVSEKVLTANSLVVTDDGEKVKEIVEKYLKGKNLLYLQNLYNGNSGDWNSGNGNSGSGNSGDWNSGSRNSGSRNSGDWNSGSGNSGNGNSGSGNSSSGNSGSGNSSSGNSGDWNSGSRNSGNRNSGSRNSGNGNSGDWNSGNGNSGCIIGHFSSEKQYFLFNKKCSEEEANKIYRLKLWNNFCLNKWISENEMTAEEKEKNPSYKITVGYLKTFTYKEAWANIPKEHLQEVKKLKNFSKKVFKEITGINL